MLTTKIRFLIKRKRLVGAIVLCLILLTVFCAGIVLTGALKSAKAEDVTPGIGVAALENAPQNTLMSLERALNAHDFRTDLLYYKVFLTADGILVTLDGKLDEQSNAQSFFAKKRAEVCDYTYAQLRNLNMGENFENHDFPYRGLRGENIPESLKILSVTELFERCRPYTQMRFVIELGDSGKMLKKAVGRLAALAAQFGVQHQLYVVGSQRAATLIDKDFPDIQRAATPSETAALYFSFVFGAAPMALKYKTLFLPSNNCFLNLADKDLIKYARSKGLKVFILAKSNRKDISNQIKRNADVVISATPSITYDVLTRG